MKVRRRRHDDAHRPGAGRGARAFHGGSGASAGPAVLTWPAEKPRTWTNALAVAREQLAELKASGRVKELGSWDQIGIAVDRVRRMLQA